VNWNEVVSSHQAAPTASTRACAAWAWTVHAIAQSRGQTLAQLALAWVLRHKAMTSVLIGASRPSQVCDAVAALGRLSFAEEELAAIERLLARPDLGMTR